MIGVACRVKQRRGYILTAGNITTRRMAPASTAKTTIIASSNTTNATGKVCFQAFYFILKYNVESLYKADILGLKFLNLYKDVGIIMKIPLDLL